MIHFLNTDIGTQRLPKECGVPESPRKQTNKTTTKTNQPKVAIVTGFSRGIGVIANASPPTDMPLSSTMSAARLMPKKSSRKLRPGAGRLSP